MRRYLRYVSRLDWVLDWVLSLVCWIVVVQCVVIFRGQVKGDPSLYHASDITQSFLL